MSYARSIRRSVSASVVVIASTMSNSVSVFADTSASVIETFAGTSGCASWIRTVDATGTAGWTTKPWTSVTSAAVTRTCVFVTSC